MQARRAEAHDMGGVFINYRSVDNPLAAASIYEWLALKFGSHRVFRDCVSLDSGTHYPSSIRSALENAQVLLAVIGPQWLALRDPETRERLIDRPQDWVRREIATAFDREIVILPVLLKDTPENAYLPAPDDLPKEIRGLAMIQALEISQRRLGADLAHLARTLGRLHPALLSATPTAQDVFYALVAALEAVPCLHHEDTRNLVVSQLRPAIAGNVRYSPQRRIHAMNIIRTCLDYEGGLTELIATIIAFEGETVPLRQLVSIAGQLPSESGPGH
jgi:hypothetical protein